MCTNLFCNCSRLAEAMLFQSPFTCVRFLTPCLHMLPASTCDCCTGCPVTVLTGSKTRLISALEDQRIVIRDDDSLIF